MSDFFQQISKYLKGYDIKMSLAQAGETLTVGIFPTHKNTEISEKLKPIMVTGTAEEFDRELFEKIGSTLETAAGLAVSIEGYNTQLKELEGTKKETVEKKQEKKAGSAIRKKTAATPAQKKQDTKKQEVKKPVAKKAAAAQPAKKKNKITIRMQVDALLAEKKFEEATAFVKKANEKGGLNKAKIDELYALIKAAQGGTESAAVEIAQAELLAIPAPMALENAPETIEEQPAAEQEEQAAGASHEEAEGSNYVDFMKS